MKRIIKKVAVLGSGVMGSRIACHFANVGIETLLLDIVPRELNDKEKAAGLTLEDKKFGIASSMNLCNSQLNPTLLRFIGNRLPTGLTPETSKTI